MQVKIFNIPLLAYTAEEESLNKFLRSHRILQVSKALISDNGGFWTVFVEYMEGYQTEVPGSRRNKDYSKELSPQEYERYSRYREIRKAIADEKSVPPYLVFTNEELAVLSRYEVLTKDVLEGIRSIPERRIRDYGWRFISNGEESRTSDGTDMPF